MLYSCIAAKGCCFAALYIPEYMLGRRRLFPNVLSTVNSWIDNFTCFASSWLAYSLACPGPHSLYSLGYYSQGASSTTTAAAVEEAEAFTSTRIKAFNLETFSLFEFANHRRPTKLSSCICYTSYALPYSIPHFLGYKWLIYVVSWIVCHLCIFRILALTNYFITPPPLIIPFVESFLILLSFLLLTKRPTSIQTFIRIFPIPTPSPIRLLV